MSLFRHGGPAFLVATLIAGVAACGRPGGPGPGSAAGATPGTPPAASADPLARLSAYAIAEKALADTRAATSVHLAGTITDSGQKITLAETIVHGGTECSGRLSVEGKGSVQIILLGTTLWLKPDDTYWQSSGIPAADLPKVAGKWVRSATSATGASSMAAPCSLTKMLSDTVPVSSAYKDPIIAPDGKVLTWEIMDTSDRSSIYVTDTASPLITRIDGPPVDRQETVASTGSIDLTGYGAATTITAPPASDVVGPGTLGG